MFCRTAYYALVTMITLTRHKGKGLSVHEIAQINNIPIEALDGVSHRLYDGGFVTIAEGRLSLSISPEDITIWQILEGVSDENLFHGGCYKEGSGLHLLHPRSTTTIMLDKERELMLKVIEGRLSRYKLSQWSEMASKTVYV